MPKRVDITGKTYGHLTVNGLTEKVKGVRSRQWVVSCTACDGVGAGITPAQAATALRSYLTTGDARWDLAVA